MENTDYGTPPGTAFYTGKVPRHAPGIVTICYDADHIEVSEHIPSENLIDSGKTHCWSHVTPISDASRIRQICDKLHIHPLVSEDILTVAHRPKVDEYEDYLFIILKSADYVDSKLVFNHHAFILFDHFLLSFSDFAGKFAPVTDRIKKASGRVRQRNHAYLFFLLADLILDRYFFVLEKLGDTIEDLEAEVLNDPDKKSVEQIHKIKGQLIALRRAVWPMRESINALIRSDFIDDSNHIYFKDLYDHTIEILDTVEGYRDTISGFLDIYLSTLSNRMNEIMKTLSIIATIFIPLSFLTGYFGMNFKYETVLESEKAYFWSNMSIFIIPALMLIYFKIRKWF